MKKSLLLSLLFIVLFALPLFATDEEVAAIIAARRYTLPIANCPPLEYVAGKQLINIRWSNPGGGDKTFCYARVSGFQKNHERFDATFRYDVETKKIEPFSIRKGGQKEIFRQDLVQKELMKFYSTVSNEVWQEMKKIR